MAKRKHADAAESSDDDAPEAFSFGSSKKAAKGEQEAVRQFQAAQKLKQKEKNRSTDHKLKARAADTKTAGKGKAKDAAPSHWEKATRGKGAEVAEADFSDDEDASEGEAGASGRSALEERMARAMRDAEEEDSDLEGSDEEEGSAFEGFGGEDAGAVEDDNDEEGMSEDDDEGEEMDDEEDEEEDEDEEMESGSEEDEDEEEEEAFQPSTSKAPAKNRNYLPDHLFKSALSTPRNTKITFDDEDTAPSRARASPPQKRRRAKRSTKDIVLGSRTIRTLPKSSEAISPAATKGLPPPRRVNKFLKHSLNVKGDANKAKTKGWTRRPANLGVMKRSGPAANFVRSS